MHRLLLKSYPMKSLLRLTITASLLAALAAPSAVEAQPGADLLELRLEGGAGYLLASDQREVIDAGFTLYGGARIGLRIARFDFADAALRFSLGYETYFLPSPIRSAQQHSILGGLAFSPALSDSLRLPIDVHAGLGISGGKSRFAMSAGIGLDLTIWRAVVPGLFVRYGRIFANSADHPSDAQYLVGGISLSFGWWREDSLRDYPDADGDNVPDAFDPCPDSAPSGGNEDPERPGCTIDERPDPVGVSASGTMQCPDAAGPAAVTTVSTECTVPDPFIIRPIYFRVNDDRLDDTAAPVLQVVVDLLRSEPRIRIVVVGHADETGPAEYNRQLALRRANAAADWIRAAGIASDRIEIEARGEEMPAIARNTPDARAANRRVEFEVVSGER